MLPAVRAAAPGTLIVADGFSCREQIGQATGRHALHLADVVRLALGGPGGDRAAQTLVVVDGHRPRAAALPAAVTTAAVVAVGAVIAARRVRSPSAR